MAFLLGVAARVARRRRVSALSAAAAVGCCTFVSSSTMSSSCDPAVAASEEPSFTAKEVATHSSMSEGGVWVSFGGNVYDVTEFVKHHPGGNHILAAAGGPLEPLWAHWQVHLSGKVLAELSRYRIGRLDLSDHMRNIYDVSDPYASDPERDPRLRVLGERPFDCETAHECLASSFFTPQSLFYVRNHLPVPEFAESEYQLQVDAGEGGGGGTRTFSLADLRHRLPQARLEATLQCTGNRCNELEPSAAGGIGQIGTAVWQGVWLRDLLEMSAVAGREGGKGGDDVGASRAAQTATAGPSPPPPPPPPPARQRHLHASGSDGYEISIPLEKAVDPRGDTLVAHSINGEPLSRDHGAPVRLIVPGFVGARSVKWLTNLTVHDAESESVWQRRYYRVFPPWVKTLEQIDYEDRLRSPPAYAFPVQSAIVEPAHGETVAREDDGTVRVRGYAVSGGGQRVVSVRVSADDGKEWCEATLQDGPRAGQTGAASAAAAAAADDVATPSVEVPEERSRPYGREWSWVLWEARVRVPPDQSGQLKLCCKATDSSYNTQPEQSDHIYNLRGYMSNAWPRVRASVVNSAE